MKHFNKYISTNNTNHSIQINNTLFYALILVFRTCLNFNLNVFSLQMDNAAYIRDTETQTKSKEVRIQLQARDNPNTGHPTITPTSGNGSDITTKSDNKACKADICKRGHTRSRTPQSVEGPWHKHKTFYLLILVILFIIWVIIYSIISAFNLV